MPLWRRKRKGKTKLAFKYKKDAEQHARQLKRIYPKDTIRVVKSHPTPGFPYEVARLKRVKGKFRVIAYSWRGTVRRKR